MVVGERPASANVLVFALRSCSYAVLSIIGLVLSERGRVLATEPSGSGEAREGKRATSLRQPNTPGGSYADREVRHCCNHAVEPSTTIAVEAATVASYGWMGGRVDALRARRTNHG